MCLISRTYLKRHIAKQDIKVEKQLYYNGYILCSPIYGKRYSIGELYIGAKPWAKKMLSSSYGERYAVKIAFHSYKAIKVLKNNINGYCCHNAKNLNDFIILVFDKNGYWPVIAECTIPKGSVYYTHNGAYASEMLKINNIKDIIV